MRTIRDYILEGRSISYHRRRIEALNRMSSPDVDLSRRQMRIDKRVHDHQVAIRKLEKMTSRKPTNK
jgi:hypothetical protein